MLLLLRLRRTFAFRLGLEFSSNVFRFRDPLVARSVVVECFNVAFGEFVFRLARFVGLFVGEVIRGVVKHAVLDRLGIEFLRVFQGQRGFEFWVWFLDVVRHDQPLSWAKNSPHKGSLGSGDNAVSRMQCECGIGRNSQKRDGVTVEFSQPSVFIGRLAADGSVSKANAVDTVPPRIRGGCVAYPTRDAAVTSAARLAQGSSHRYAPYPDSSHPVLPRRTLT